MISLSLNRTCSFATKKYRPQTLTYLETTVEAFANRFDVLVSVLLNTSVQEIETAIQSLLVHAITTFSLEDAKEDMPQIPYRSNNINRTNATMAILSALSLRVTAISFTTACKRQSQRASRTERKYK